MTSAAIDEMRAANYEISQAIAPEPGDSVLELAAGVGDTGFDVAELIGDGGRLISSDFSPAMLDAARRRGSERGVDNTEYRIIDAQRIALEDDSVDGIICRFAYMLIADPADALVEARRVLRPGGRLVLAVWGRPEENPYFTTIVASLMRCGHRPPLEPPPAPGIFTLASPERITELLRDAGFAEVRTTGVRIRYMLRDAATYVAIYRRHRRSARSVPPGPLRRGANATHRGPRAGAERLRQRRGLRRSRTRTVRDGELTP